MLADAGVPVLLKPVGIEDLAHAIESVASERTRARSERHERYL